VRPETPQDGPSFEKRWRQRFQKFAENSEDDAGIAGWSPTGLEVRLRNFERLRCGRPFSGMWLDAGCGAGTYCRFLRDRGARVVGLDYSLPSLQKASQRDRSGIPWVNADVTRLPLKPAGFDGVLCFGVMQALADSRPAIAELCAAVRPGGSLYVDALNARCLPNLWDRFHRKLKKLPMHLRYERPGDLARLVRENGLEDVRCHWVPILPKRLQQWQRLVETPLVRWTLRYVPLAGTCFSHAFWVTARRPGVL
jgi:SAM-dependent methyltransferase